MCPNGQRDDYKLVRNRQQVPVVGQALTGKKSVQQKVVHKNIESDLEPVEEIYDVDIGILDFF